MTNIKKLRELAEIAARHNGYGVFTTDECQNFSDAANPQDIIELLDRLERYEKALTYYAYEIVADSLNAGKTTITTATGRIAREALEGGK